MRVIDNLEAKDVFIKMGNLYENSDYVLEDYVKVFHEAGLEFNNVCYGQSLFYDFYYVEDELGIPLRINPMRPEMITKNLLKGIKLVKDVKDGKAPVREILRRVERRYHLHLMECIYWEIENIESVREAFRSVYRNIENGFDRMDADIFEDAFTLTKEEKENNIKPILKLLKDDILTIYRGQSDKSTDLKIAHSWTCDEKVAKFFANRFDADGNIYRARVHKDNIIYYSNSRSEKEILVDFDDLEDIETI